MPDERPLLLFVIPEHIGGRRLGTPLSAAIADRIQVVVVERTAEDPDALARADVLVTALGTVTAEDLAAASRLRAVQCASHGFDYVDVDAARARGIPVANIGGTDAERRNVAEHTFALLLALAKQLIPAHLALRQGDWALPRLQRSLTELSGRTLGVVGLGAIGREVAALGGAFGMEVIHTNRHGAGDAGWRPLDDLLRQADYVTLHLPLTPESRGLIDARRLSLMKATAFLVNTSRGALVDQNSLAQALERGAIAGAGLDVFWPEPPPANLRLLQAPNVVLTPHLAGVTRETVVRIAQAAVANALTYLTTGRLADTVN